MTKFKKPIITIITASWNREKFLKKLGDSLIDQTFQNFEWIIGNDGSEDNTDDIVKSIAQKANFRIIYIKSSLRIGKSKMDNIMMNHVSGEYLTQCGSDDTLYKDSLEVLLNLIQRIPKNEKDEYIGVLANSIDTNGKSQTYAEDTKPIYYENLYWEEVKKKIKGDGTILEQFKFLKDKKFLEVDFLISESSLLNKIYLNKKFILTNKVVKVMDRSAINSISFGKKLRYCRGSAFCIAEEETNLKFKKYSLLQKLKIILNFWRYTIHGDINFLKAKKMLEPTNKNFFYTIVYPFSYLICIRDNILGKVEKTHIEFNKNIKNTTITLEHLN
jgi:glycosyltransferase involved in cell wall biosynthesis